MQSICSLLPEPFAQHVLGARAIAAEEPSIGAIYDPPFSHITLQLAEEYDWDGLTKALAAFAAKEEPFEAEAVGLLVFSNGDIADIAVLPHLSEQLRQFHDRLWEAALPFAKGNIRKMDYPPTWQPHVTIKRCGSDHEALRECALVSPPGDPVVSEGVLERVFSGLGEIPASRRPR
jgi:2'-5' RNA ligase